MRAAGFVQPVHVLSDDPAPAGDLLGCEVEIHAPPLGGLRNWCRALERLVEATTDRWVMVCEDDILWAKGAAAALAQDMKTLDDRAHPVGYLSLYLARKVSREIEIRRNAPKLSPGLYTSGLGRSCWGSQAYVMQRGVAIALLANPEFDTFRRTYEKNRNRDNIVSGCLAAMGRRLYYRVPALVSHELGNANSSLATKPVQQSLLCDYWTGKP